MKFVEACALSQIAPGKSLALRLEGKDVALFNVDGEVFALENACPHHGSALAGGCLSGHVVRCPAHGLRFNVATGAHVSIPQLAVATFRVRVTDDLVQVALDA